MPELPAAGNVLSGAGGGKARVGAWQRGAFAIWRGDGEGRKGREANGGKKVICNACVVRNCMLGGGRGGISVSCDNLSRIGPLHRVHAGR